MAMVRANPLPAGRYWIFLGPQPREIFDLWLSQHASSVQVQKKEESGGLWPFVSPNETFYIFALTVPTVWPRGIGFPNAADTATQQAADVVQRPPPMTARDVVKDIQETAAEAASAAMLGTAVVVVIALWVLSKRSR